jgi:hypothetical protein
MLSLGNPRMPPPAAEAVIAVLDRIDVLFPAGNLKAKYAFDGRNISVTNSGSNTASELNSTNGQLVSTYLIGATRNGIRSTAIPCESPTMRACLRCVIRPSGSPERTFSSTERPSWHAERPFTMTRAPSRASPVAMANPMPLLASPRVNCRPPRDQTRLGRDNCPPGRHRERSEGGPTGGTKSNRSRSIALPRPATSAHPKLGRDDPKPSVASYSPITTVADCWSLADSAFGRPRRR